MTEQLTLSHNNFMLFHYVCNGIALSHWKEWNNAICSYMDGPTDYHTKQSKSERERQISCNIIGGLPNPGIKPTPPADVQAGFRKGKGTRDQIANIPWIIKKAREFQKNIHFCFIDYAKAFVWITINCGKFWKRWDHLTCLLRNLYAGQEATVRTGYGTTDWFQIRKGVHQGCILSPWLFNLCEEYIMRNAGLDEAQAGIKIAGRNNNNLR